MIQAGPVANVHMPKDKITGVHQGFGFVEFRSEDDAEYAIKVCMRVRWVCCVYAWRTCSRGDGDVSLSVCVCVYGQR